MQGCICVDNGPVRNAGIRGLFLTRRNGRQGGHIPWNQCRLQRVSTGWKRKPLDTTPRKRIPEAAAPERGTPERVAYTVERSSQSSEWFSGHFGGVSSLLQQRRGGQEPETQRSGVLRLTRLLSISRHLSVCCTVEFGCSRAEPRVRVLRQILQQDVLRRTHCDEVYMALDVPRLESGCRAASPSWKGRRLLYQSATGA